MVQFHLLKYLKYDSLIKLQALCKDGGYLCDDNLQQDGNKEKEMKLTIKIIKKPK